MSEPNEWIFPASYGQERMWLASQLQPDSSVYNVSMSIPLPPTVDADAIVSALRRVVDRHEALRTSFRTHDAGLSQVVHRDVAVLVAHDPDRDDLRGLPPAEVESRFYERCFADAQVRFALDRPPLWRARLVRTEDEWRLLVAGHHTIFDAASWGIVWAELNEICAATTQGTPPRLRDVDIQYADWSVWQRDQLLTPARLERELAWWRSRLDGAPPVHSLPTDRARGTVQEHAGAEVRFEIPEAVAQRVTQLARRLRVTEFAVLFAAYAALLARLGGQPDVVVGVPVAGRDQEQVARLVGMFVNTMVLRVDTSADPTFEELVGQVAAATVAALEHSAVPVQLVVEDLVPRRDPRVAPLYQLGFNHLPGVPLNFAYGTARDELGLEVSGREARIEYRTALFDAATVHAIADRYLRVLDAVTSGPDRRVSRIPLLDRAERARLLGFGAGPDPAEEWSGATVPELILAQAARTPDAVAARTADASLTYRDLVGRAWTLADRLRDRGVGPDQVVAIALPRSPELVVAILGVLLAGGGYLPLDPALPPERLAFMLADSGARVVLTSGRSALPETGLTVLDVTDLGPFLGDGTVSAGPDSLAYVIYTSGTTGRPKGSAIAHRSLANVIRWLTARLGLGPADRVLASTSPSFDAFGVELFPALVAGATVVLAPGAEGFDPDALLHLVAQEGVTVLPTVPSVLRTLVDSPVLTGCTTVRQVVVGGEQLSAELAADLAARLPVPLHNLYGPTETTIAVSGHTLPPTDRYTAVVPIGRPLSGARLYLLDDAGDLAPLGAVGHLHVGGLPVGRGYLGRPALTAERFVPDPFGPPGARLYRTGDLARWTADGTLWYVGRTDNQVKIRGLRIEPVEIEAVLREQPGVRDAAVLVREDVPGDRRLVAYIRAADDADPAAMRTVLRQTLPDYMVPAAIVTLASFPLTAHGKLDLAAFPAPDYAAGGRRYTAPRTATERLIATVWAEVLDVDRPGADDDFLALGGHSLLAARIAVRLSDALGSQIPIHLLFSHLSLRELAAAVEDLMADEIGALSEEEAARLLSEVQG